MCTVVILRRPDDPWPLLLAANRDEMFDRPWRPPGRHWPDRPEVTAGIDELAGGSWLGLNDHGLVAGVLNRMGSLGPAPGQRSRGELVLEALDHGDAVDAAQALSALDPTAYRPFNMVVADNRDAYWLRNREGGDAVEVEALEPGLSMLTAHDLNDEESARIAAHLPRFRAAPAPDPAIGDWRAWEALMASREGGANREREGAMAIVTDWGFGTVSGALIALPEIGAGEGIRPVWRFAPGLPGETPYAEIQL